MPPVGAPAPVASPPIALPAHPGSAAGVAPFVESYDEITYRSKAGDTFQSISKEQYNSDLYAGALLAYNRVHPQNQSPSADNLRRDQPVLSQGQAVYVPPMRILEKQFPIQGLAPVPPVAPPQSVPAAVSPAGLNAFQRGVPAPAAVSVTGTSRSSPPGLLTYRVPPPGVSLRELARQTLNNPDRWYEIARLNTQIPSNAYAYPIAAGTVLYMPADARLSPAPSP